jgi:signal transduction histidine kinase
VESSIFTDKSVQPDNYSLAQVLGENRNFWEAMKQHIREKHGDVIEQWKFYSTKYGWTLKTLLKKRNLFFFTPLDGYFRIGFVFGDKAVAVIENSDLPGDIINELKNARKYAEGRGIAIEVKNQGDVENVKKLIDIKINN